MTAVSTLERDLTLIFSSFSALDPQSALLLAAAAILFFTDFLDGLLARLYKEESKLGSPIGCLFYEFYNDKKEITKLINNNSDSIQCVVSNINFNTNIKFGQTQCPNINDYADNNDTIKFLLKI